MSDHRTLGLPDRLRSLAQARASNQPVSIFSTIQIDEMTESIAANEIERLSAQVAELEIDAGRLDWLEQHGWATEQECFDFVDAWRTPDGKRHGEGLRAAIDALKAGEGK